MYGISQGRDQELITSKSALCSLRTCSDYESNGAVVQKMFASSPGQSLSLTVDVYSHQRDHCTTTIVASRRKYIINFAGLSKAQLAFILRAYLLIVCN